jgi:uncharacterized membrane protein YdbT with pleckstrin-like domain
MKHPFDHALEWFAVAIIVVVMALAAGFIAWNLANYWLP